MSLPNPFKLEKLRIEAYEKETRALPAQGRLEVMFNPTSYERKATVAYASRARAINSITSPARYTHTPPEKFSFTFIVDGTGAAFFGAEHLVRLARGRSVKADIQKFQVLCLKTNGRIHEPNFLKIVWGSHFDVFARLTAMEVKYTLFDRGGDPLRAEIKASFVEDIPVKTGAQQIGLNSPDLTHVRVVQSGDTLPLLCKDIYGSGEHYLMVAAANGLDDFRRLVPGRSLRFPPLP